MYPFVVAVRHSTKVGYSDSGLGYFTPRVRVRKQTSPHFSNGRGIDLELYQDERDNLTASQR